MSLRIVFVLPFLVLLFLPAGAWAQDRAQRAMEINDANRDGKVSPKEWRRSSSIFKQIDTNKDGFLTVDEFRARFAGGKGPMGGGMGGRSDKGGPKLDGQVGMGALDKETMCAITRTPNCDISVAVKHGLFKTGLKPVFPAGVECRGIDEAWAIDYSDKRDREQYHGGIDIPAPFGTPMIAAAAGTVVAKYVGEKSYRGIEITLRHSPEDTGLGVWTYTQYAHFRTMPTLNVGDRVRMGQKLGPTGNSGIQPNLGPRGSARRPAIHFAAWFTGDPRYVAASRAVIPVAGEWMDPNALYRGKPPFDSASLKALPSEQKRVPIAVMLDTGEVIPAGARVIWPYTCSRR